MKLNRQDRIRVLRDNVDIDSEDNYVFTGRNIRGGIIATGTKNKRSAENIARVTLRAGGKFGSIRTKNQWRQRYIVSRR